MPPSMKLVVRRMLEPGAPGVGGRWGRGAREGVAHDEAPHEEAPLRMARSWRTEASMSPGD